jgi:hypothetical protein
MKNQTKFLIFFALVLGAIYAYRFTDWFSEKKIQIKYRVMAGRGEKSAGADPVTFYLMDRAYELTSVKVISLDEAATNKYPRAYWHLVSDSNSVSVADFLYGENLAGMKPKVPGLAAWPLKAGGNYRIFIEAGKLKGEKDFQAVKN